MSSELCGGVAEISAVSAAGRLLRARSLLVAVAGLIGLGGSEFRLPLVIGAFGFFALQAVIERPLWRDDQFVDEQHTCQAAVTRCLRRAR